MEAAMKRKEMDKQVLQARAAQIEEAKRIRAQIDRQEAIEQQKVIEKIKKEEEREKADKEKMHRLKDKYRAGMVHCSCCPLRALINHLFIFQKLLIKFNEKLKIVKQLNCSVFRNVRSKREWRKLDKRIFAK